MPRWLILIGSLLIVLTASLVVQALTDAAWAGWTAFGATLAVVALRMVGFGIWDGDGGDGPS